MMPASHILARQIAAAQARYRALSLGRGAAWALAFLCAVLLLTALFDWSLNLPRPLRLTLALANAATALFILFRHGIRPAARGIDQESVALAIERMDHRFATRLIAAIQLTRPGALAPGESTAVVATMIQETETAAHTLDFRRAINPAGFRRAATALDLLLLAGIALFAAGQERSLPLMFRALGSPQPWPARTHVEVTSGSYLIAIGDPATIRARAIGYRPATGIAKINYPGNRQQQLTLSRISDTEYAGTLENVAEPFDYTVHLYDGTSTTFHIDAQPRPAVISLTCTQIYPAYTTLGEVPRDPADLLLLSGSRLRLRLTVNRDLKGSGTINPSLPASRIIFVTRSDNPTATAPAPLTLQPDPRNPRAWTAEFQPTAAIAGFSIHLIDTQGLESRNEPVYPLRLTADRPPTIRLLHPDLRQILATADATCPLAFTAEDDFGLSALSLHFRVDEQPEVVVPFTLPASQKEAREDYAWRLSTIAPPAGHPTLEGSVLDFFVEARDNNPSTPGVAASEHYQIRIVSKADKQAELISRMATSFAGIQELSDKQSKTAADLKAISLPPTTKPGGN